MVRVIAAATATCCSLSVVHQVASAICRGRLVAPSCRCTHLSEQAAWHGSGNSSAPLLHLDIPRREFFWIAKATVVPQSIGGWLGYLLALLRAVRRSQRSFKSLLTISSSDVILHPHHRIHQFKHQDDTRKFEKKIFFCRQIIFLKFCYYPLILIRN